MSKAQELLDLIEKGEFEAWIKVFPKVQKEAIIIQSNKFYVGSGGKLRFKFNDHDDMEKLDDLMDDKSNWDADVEFKLGSKIHKMKGNFLGSKNEFIFKKIDKKSKKEIMDLVGI